MKEALPGMRPDGIAEQCPVSALFEPISPAVLLVGPADGQFIETRDAVIYDRSVAHSRANHTVALAGQSIDDPLYTIRLDCELDPKHIRYIPSRQDLLLLKTRQSLVTSVR